MKDGKLQLKTISIIILCGIAILASGCHSGITRIGYQLPVNTDTRKLDKCSIAIQSDAKYERTEVQLLGSIHSYDTGFSTDCDEAYTLDIFCREGCLLGADVINITQDKQPDLWSTCYRAKADFLRLNDREKAKKLYSDARCAPNLIIDRSVKSSKRTREMIASMVFGGALGGLVTWEATSPGGH